MAAGLSGAAAPVRSDRSVARVASGEAPARDGGEQALACQDVTVTYGPVVALRDVTVGFAPGRIHAVVGQNGAGKTTFARVCAGIVRPDEGRLLIGGRAIATGDVDAVRGAGLELVHQSFALPPSFTVAEAMEFGSRRESGRPYTRRGLEARWAPHLAALGIKVRLGARIRDLPVETQQAVEIARALVTEARVLILDEPTAVLAPAGVEILFDRLRALRDGGVTVLLILHKIREVLAVAETVTVLRGGRLVEGPVETAGVDARHLAASIIGSAPAELPGGDIAALVGAEETPHAAVAAPAAATRPTALVTHGVSTREDGEGRPLEAVDLTVHRGEIVGVAGVEGNGQRTLMRAIAGLAGLAGGTIRLGDADVTARSLVERRAAGLRMIPFERNTEGLSLSSALWENWAARPLLGGATLRLIDPARLRRLCEASLKQWNVRFAATTQPAGSLSGGNAQKVILAREVDEDAALLIAAQPTRGLDIGATEFVWQSLRASRARGCGVLLISSDLDELFDISDRIVVMLSGRIVGRFTPPYELDAVGAAMTGVER
ncbi:MAG TPA: ATP-binding cassette domain-containing protein [Acetobacteraceae bacterium]|nr:ATP-binding cassette domain-containing protein [Acetobacteraceae bacterium]